MEFTIENNFLCVRVQSRGAELCSVVKKETGEEMLWQADPAVWNRHAPILFPYCGRLKGGAFTHNGVSYEGGQHGFARDMEHALVEQSGDSVTLCLEANVLTMEKFPFAFKLFSTFRLEGVTVHHDIRVENDGGEVMPFAFGYHPAFLCPFDAAHKAEDYVLRFDTPQTPTVGELEQKAKAGEPISLIDLANAIHADKERGKEEKPSIRAQLRAAKEQTAQRKAQRSKTQDLERT